MQVLDKFINVLPSWLVIALFLLSFFGVPKLVTEWVKRKIIQEREQTFRYIEELKERINRLEQELQTKQSKIEQLYERLADVQTENAVLRMENQALKKGGQG